MSPEQFLYWLQGFFEIQSVGVDGDIEGINPKQTRIIRDHLQLVFEKETPDRTIDIDKLLERIPKKKDFLEEGIVYTDPSLDTVKFC